MTADACSSVSFSSPSRAVESKVTQVEEELRPKDKLQIYSVLSRDDPGPPYGPACLLHTRLPPDNCSNVGINGSSGFRVVTGGPAARAHDDPVFKNLPVSCDSLRRRLSASRV